MPSAFAARAGALVALLALTTPTLAQPARPAGTPPASVSAPETRPRLPTDSTTHHRITLADGSVLGFSATAGSFTVTSNQFVPQAAIAFTSFVLDGANEARPVTFAFNGGPGAASAWLQLGVLGPWRMPMQPADATPSAAVAPRDNPETWLAFTDLVFIDPVGTGYSRLLADGEEVRKRFWSVNGDIDALAEIVRRWLAANHRMAAPKYIIGESYGGFRGPRLVRALASEAGIGISGLVLLSPVLDFTGSPAFDPLSWVWALPTETAVARARTGDGDGDGAGDGTRPVSRADLADVETYAAGDYLVDLVRGDGDAAALARRVANVARFTGLDPALLKRRRGRVNNFEFSREHDRATSEVDSLYDLTARKPDAFPAQAFANNPDAMTDALDAPFTSAMVDIYDRRLGWHVDAPYVLNNRAVNRQWDFGAGRAPESLVALRADLAADPHLRVLVAHGLFDLVTPYFRTRMQLDQIDPAAGADRVRFLALPGGHMFYSRDDSRAAFTAAARDLYLPR